LEYSTFPLQITTLHLPLLFLLALLPRPPTFTLFPYTTLFRSGVRGTARPAHLPGLGHDRDVAGRVHGRAPVRPRRGGRRDALGLDRKSTRLNSSHEWISYAVFCLKKKKINDDSN